jgi:hypothetical protein
MRSPHPPKTDLPSRQKHRIAEGRLQIQPLAQAQTVVQLLKQTLDQSDRSPEAKAGAIALTPLASSFGFDHLVTQSNGDRLRVLL